MASSEAKLSDWGKALDEETGEIYYFNKVTQEVSWTLPEENDALPSGWKVLHDPMTDLPYYEHVENQISQWFPPSVSEKLGFTDVDSLLWYYLTDELVEHGPFDNATMRDWCVEGHFPKDLQVKNGEHGQFIRLFSCINLIMAETEPPRPTLCPSRLLNLCNSLGEHAETVNAANEALRVANVALQGVKYQILMALKGIRPPSPNGITVFSGAWAVSWLVSKSLAATVDDAISLGSLLLEHGVLFARASSIFSNDESLYEMGRNNADDTSNLDKRKSNRLPVTSLYVQNATELNVADLEANDAVDSTEQKTLREATERAAAADIVISGKDFSSFLRSIPLFAPLHDSQLTAMEHSVSGLSLFEDGQYIIRQVLLLCYSHFITEHTLCV